MDETDRVSEWIQRWAAGDQAAAEALFAQYSARLTHIAQQHLDRKLAAREDPDDVLQSVFRTFFRRSALKQFEIDDSGQLWRLLVKITLQKARKHGRFHTAQKRNATAEVQPEEESWLPEVLSREPDPAEAAELLDLMQAMMQDVPELYCRILKLRLQGMAPTDVARELSISRNTVYRAMELFQQRLNVCSGDET